MQRRDALARTIKIGILGALAFLLMFTLEVYIPPFANFLKYDPGDVPAAVATFTLGPAAGIWVEGIKSVLFYLSGKSSAGLIGVMANFLAGGAFVVGIALVNGQLKRFEKRHWAWDLLAAAGGTLFMTLLLIPLNALLVYPVWGMQGAAAWSAALVISTPFNLFKGFLSSAISLVLYRRLAGFLVGKPAGSVA